MKNPNQKIQTSKRRLAKAFDKWLADWKKDPSSFTTLKNCEPKTYGERCADFLIERLK